MTTRGAGILLHVSSLPDGRMSSAFKFIDFLAQSGIKYWQVLAMNPTGYGDSPYSPLSVFAGNPKLIDPKRHCEERSDEATPWQQRFSDFKKENKYWLDGYVKFMCKRDPKAHVDHNLEQFTFFEQWAEVKKYANERGIQIIGDVPIYTAMDSADIATWPEQFDLTNGQPNGVAGVPPDYFNEDGQLWGNPLYNFKKMARDGYKWWCERIKLMAKMYDVIRIDHFRAFDTYYRVPFGATTAKEGTWCKGPGIKVFQAMKQAAPALQIILEDLGDLAPSVHTLREQTGLPGMKVMQFGFDGNPNNEHLPSNYPTNCVGYIGTHDNDTFVGWLREQAAVGNRRFIDEYLESYYLGEKNTTRLAIENILDSRANVVILTMQDILFQDSHARMNVPGRALGNWKYRIKQSDLGPETSDYLKLLVERSGR